MCFVHVPTIYVYTIGDQIIMNDLTQYHLLHLRGNRNENILEVEPLLIKKKYCHVFNDT